MTRGRTNSVLDFLRGLVAAPRTGLPSDGQLLERFTRQRDEAAFTELVQRHGPMVLGVCRRLLADPDDAEDAFQATFLVLVRKAAVLADAEAVGNWLHGVARRTALKARAAAARRRVRQRKMVDVAAPEHADSLWRDLGPVLDEEVGRLPACCPGWPGRGSGCGPGWRGAGWSSPPGRWRRCSQTGRGRPSPWRCSRRSGRGFCAPRVGRPRYPPGCSR